MLSAAAHEINRTPTAYEAKGIRSVGEDRAESGRGSYWTVSTASISRSFEASVTSVKGF
jgi:hypothetical protein